MTQGGPRGRHDLIQWAAVKITAAATTLLVGAFILSEIIGVMPTPESDQMANATNQTIATTSNAITLGAVALIVLVASIMLILISDGFSGGGGREPPRNGGNGGTPPMH